MNKSSKIALVVLITMELIEAILKAKAKDKEEQRIKDVENQIELLGDAVSDLNYETNHHREDINSIRKDIADLEYEKASMVDLTTLKAWFYSKGAID